MTSSLPSPTTEIDQAKFDLAEHGYCIVAGALDAERLATLRDRLVEQAQGEDAAGVGFHDSNANQRLWMLVNKGQAFRDLITDPVTETFMGELLGRDFLLSSLTANIARPGGEPMQLHTDQIYVGFWTPKPVVANIAWMLDAFTDENGGTRVVPGSHKHPRRDYTQEDTVAAVGPAGAALVFDGRLVHGTGQNRSAADERHAVLSYHCRPFMRQQENFSLGLDPGLRRSQSEAFLTRLGFRIWVGLGRTDDPDDKALIPRQEAPVGALDRGGAPLAEA